MSSYLKIDSEGLRAAKKIGDARVSSVVNVTIDNQRATGHILVLKKKGASGGHAIQVKKGRGQRRARQG